MKKTMIIGGKQHGNSMIVAGMCGIDVTTISGWRRRGLLPEPVALGRSKYYDLAEVERRLQLGEPSPSGRK